MRKPLDMIEEAWLFELQKPLVIGPGANFYYQAIANHMGGAKGSILTNDKDEFAKRHGVHLNSASKVQVEKGSFLIALEAASDLAMNGYKHPDASHVGEYKTVFVATLSDWKRGMPLHQDMVQCSV